MTEEDSTFLKMNFKKMSKTKFLKCRDWNKRCTGQIKQQID